jgi:hypothetical protein
MTRPGGLAGRLLQPCSFQHYLLNILICKDEYRLLRHWLHLGCVSGGGG